MRVYIPMALGQVVIPDVLDSIRTQTVSTEVITIERPGVISIAKTPEKLACIIKTRTELIQIMARDEDEFNVMQDRDAQHLYKDNFEKALNEIQKDKKIGALTLNFDEIPDKMVGVDLSRHIAITCVLIRKEALSAISFDKYLEGNCTCFSFGKSLREAGWAYKRLSREKMIGHLR